MGYMQNPTITSTGDGGFAYNSAPFSQGITSQQLSPIVDEFNQKNVTHYENNLSNFRGLLNDPTRTAEAMLQYGGIAGGEGQGEQLRRAYNSGSLARDDIRMSDEVRNYLQGQVGQTNTSLSNNSFIDLNNPYNIGQLSAYDVADKVGFGEQARSASTDFINSQNGGTFGKFLKGAAPLALLAGGAFLAPTLGGLFGGGAATGAGTGVAAGSAASGGFGSMLGNFATNAALKGAITGGLGGLASGGDFSSALKGAAFGGLGGGFGSSIGAGLGFGNVGQQAITGGLTGASGGLGSGNYKDALLGGIVGGGGGYLSAGGDVPLLGNMQQQMPEGVFGAPKPASGILGDLTKTAGQGLTIGGQSMNLGSLLSGAGDVYGYYQGGKDQDKMMDMLRQQSQQAQNELSPYSQAGRTALANMQGDPQQALEADAGYQFQLNQGNQALERSLAARGMGQSGAALKAAQEYGQGLANQTYNDYYNRQAQMAGQGLSAAGGLGSLYTNLGNVQGAASLQRSNDRNKLLSSLSNNKGLGNLLGRMF